MGRLTWLIFCVSSYGILLILIASIGLSSHPQKTQQDDLIQTIKAILIPRYPSSEGHGRVRNYIVNHFKSLGWHTEIDSFSTTTPIGIIEFNNLIFTRNISKPKRLILAAHYDSKMVPVGEKNTKFVGATDSAVPCAMLMKWAKALSQLRESEDFTVQIIFFDGEEAFVEWNAQDSLYGSNHLAAKWENEGKLEYIKLFILFDLIGSGLPHFYPLSDDSVPAFKNLTIIQNDLMRQNRLSNPGHSYFSTARKYLIIDDDHIPFKNRNVKTLHIIASPFPSVWHTLDDNFDNLDFDSIQDLFVIFYEFIRSQLI